MATTSSELGIDQRELECRHEFALNPSLSRTDIHSEILAKNCLERNLLAIRNNYDGAIDQSLRALVDKMALYPADLNKPPAPTTQA